MTCNFSIGNINRYYSIHSNLCLVACRSPHLSLVLFHHNRLHRVAKHASCHSAMLVCLVRLNSPIPKTCMLRKETLGDEEVQEIVWQTPSQDLDCFPWREHFYRTGAPFWYDHVIRCTQEDRSCWGSISSISFKNTEVLYDVIYVYPLTPSTWNIHTLYNIHLESFKEMIK